MSDYLKYRGKCKEACEELVKENPELKLVRGYYICPLWGKQEHWWCKSSNGNIIDPTVKQFPTKGVAAEYIEFDGYIECAECGKRIKEEDADIDGRYAFCSLNCHLKFVGL